MCIRCCYKAYILTIELLNHLLSEMGLNTAQLLCLICLRLFLITTFLITTFWFEFKVFFALHSEISLNSALVLAIFETV